MKKITNIWVAISILTLTLVCSIGGALLLGHVLETIFRIMFELSSEPFSVLIAPIIILCVLLILGTLFLASAFFIENNIIKFLIIFASVPLPIIVEVIDLLVRASHVYNDLIIMYPNVF